MCVANFSLQDIKCFRWCFHFFVCVFIVGVRRRRPRLPKNTERTILITGTGRVGLRPVFDAFQNLVRNAHIYNAVGFIKRAVCGVFF